ncbi:Cytochrome c1, partial [Dillenia turbinata]
MKWKSLRVLAFLGAVIPKHLTSAIMADSDETEEGLNRPSYPWPHNGILSSDDHSHDHSSIRRGQQVYLQVCASCQSMSLVSHRYLMVVACSEEETKAMAAEIEVVDGLNDECEMFTCPRKISDRFPWPYQNEQAADLANRGAYSPDLVLLPRKRALTKLNKHFSFHPHTKDVVTFLSWCAEPEVEDRKLINIWIFPFYA